MYSYSWLIFFIIFLALIFFLPIGILFLLLLAILFLYVVLPPTVVIEKVERNKETKKIKRKTTNTNIKSPITFFGM